jgi:hypothetical protein
LRRPRRAPIAAVALSGALLGALSSCAGQRGPAESGVPYHPDLLEPNYLPFLAHRISGDAGDGDALVFCRWSDDDMPLPVYIGTPEIPDEIQDEFDPKDPSAYVAAVEAALAMWQRDLEGLVRFRRVASPEEAKLSLMLIADRGPTPDPGLTVLGTAPLAGSCVAHGRVSGALVLDVQFSVPRARLYIADEFGLLGADQVQWIALHEIGHALGMRWHSPIPGDLMFEVVRDRILVNGLSTEDVNTFVSLYQLENGSVFGHLPSDAETVAKADSIPPPSGPPKLAMAPFVDSRHGFEVRPPAGWMRLETARGMVAVDGVTWDYSASFQVIAERYPTIEAYLDRFAAHYLAKGRVLRWQFTEVRGLRALQASVVAHDELAVEQFVFIEAGDGRLIVVVADSSVEEAAAYVPWFEAALASLEIWGASEAGAADPGETPR